MHREMDPVDSATVILLREAADGCEVLLVERHANSRAFAGAHVFPGGRIDAADADARVQAASRELTPQLAAARLGEGTSPAAALAFWIAAIRELFEEAGILLAAVDGHAVSFSDPVVQARFRAHRAAMLAGRLSFAELVTSERLQLATATLHYFSRWITPVNAPRRYDARFFVARLPAGQEPLHDDHETTATVWLRPGAALDEARAGRLVLTPPTVRTLEDLHALGSVANIVETARTHVFPTILPKTVVVDGHMAILYPGDVDYDDAVPGASLVDTGGGQRNRVVMVDGAWRSIRTRA